LTEQAELILPVVKPGDPYIYIECEKYHFVYCNVNNNNTKNVLLYFQIFKNGKLINILLNSHIFMYKYIYILENSNVIFSLKNIHYESIIDWNGKIDSKLLTEDKKKFDEFKILNGFPIRKIKN
jgi:hypothetical protein